VSLRSIFMFSRFAIKRKLIRRTGFLCIITSLLKSNTFCSTVAIIASDKTASFFFPILLSKDMISSAYSINIICLSRAGMDWWWFVQEYTFSDDSTWKMTAIYFSNESNLGHYFLNTLLLVFDTHLTSWS